MVCRERFQQSFQRWASLTWVRFSVWIFFSSFSNKAKYFWKDNSRMGLQEVAAVDSALSCPQEKAVTCCGRRHGSELSPSTVK